MPRGSVEKTERPPTSKHARRGPRPRKTALLYQTARGNGPAAVLATDEEPPPEGEGTGAAVRRGLARTAAAQRLTHSPEPVKQTQRCILYLYRKLKPTSRQAGRPTAQSCRPGAPVTHLSPRSGAPRLLLRRSSRGACPGTARGGHPCSVRCSSRGHTAKHHHSCRGGAGRAGSTGGSRDTRDSRASPLGCGPGTHMGSRGGPGAGCGNSGLSRTSTRQENEGGRKPASMHHEKSVLKHGTCGLI